MIYLDPPYGIKFGIYRITIKGAGPAGVQVSPITNLVLAWPTENHLGPLA